MHTVFKSLPTQLPALLGDPDPLVRSRAANLVGNLARYSRAFYATFQREGLLPPLVALCSDADPAARKFACFAIGNAGELAAVPCQRKFFAGLTCEWPPEGSSLTIFEVRARSCRPCVAYCSCCKLQPMRRPHCFQGGHWPGLNHNHNCDFHGCHVNHDGQNKSHK